MVAAANYESTQTRSTSGTTATYNNVALATPEAADRKVLVITSGEPDAPGGEDFSVTLNGAAATLLLQGFDPTAGLAVGAFMLSIPTGTDVDIVVTSSGTQLNNVTHVWAPTGIEDTLFDSASNADDPVNVNLDVALGGLIFGAAQFASTTAVTTTGLTERYDVSFDGNRFVSGDFGPAGSAESPRTVTFDGGTGDAFGLTISFEATPDATYVPKDIQHSHSHQVQMAS